MIVFFLPGGPTVAVRSSRASLGERGASWRPTKSEKEGMELLWSLK